MMAAQKGQLDLVELLLEKKADPLLRSKKGVSAMDLAKTEVYDAIKKACTKAKEGAREAAKKRDHGPGGEKAGGGGGVNGGGADQKKPKRAKRVHLSHFDDVEEE